MRDKKKLRGLTNEQKYGEFRIYICMYMYNMSIYVSLVSDECAFCVPYSQNVITRASTAVAYL